MRLSALSRSTCIARLLVASSVLLGACSGDTLAPRIAESPSRDASSPFMPSEASKALLGVTDGTYTFSIDPTVSNKLYLGANMLHLPASSVCDLAGSSYGASFWDDQCTPATQRLTITAVVQNAATTKPRIDFYPAMRFNPATTVTLYMFIGRGIFRQRNDKVIEYCDDNRVCIDESLTDPSVATKTDRSKSVVFRRIKHFSGYIIATSEEEQPQDPT